MKHQTFNQFPGNNILSGVYAFLLLVCLSLLSGCTQDEEFKADGVKSTINGITFNVEARGIGVAGPASKSSASNVENSSLACYDESYKIASAIIPSGQTTQSTTEISSYLKYSGNQDYIVTIAGEDYKYESILWEKDDKISIGMYAPDGTSTNSPYDRLLWDNAPQGAVFYAFWPDMANNTRTPLSMTKYSTITGGNHEMESNFTIPSTQYCTLDGSVSGKALYRPDMKYAHLSASDIVYGEGGEVNLSFYPDFTAFEFIVKNDASVQMRLKSVRLESVNNEIAGDFSSASATACSTFSVANKYSNNDNKNIKNYRLT